MSNINMPNDVKNDFGITNLDEQEMEEILVNPRKKLRLMRQVRKMLDNFTVWLKMDNQKRRQKKIDEQSIDNIKENISKM